ncbi:glycosyltransferase family 2 protein [Croceiramulus getboli]|nr:glycosyltransferase family 2 protein [Flavobacteriaceae bacterium YJPT1-3]
MKCAVVILNWNGRVLLEQFLPTVLKYSKELAEIIVVDNASTDDSVSYIQRHFNSEVRLIEHEQNWGYAGGYNKSLSQLKHEYFILLNSDVEVTANWLSPLITALQQEQVAAVQPKILDFKRKSHFEYAGAAGGFLDALGYPFCRGRLFDTLEEDEGQYDDLVDLHWASGACLAVKRKAYEEVGGLDPLFFAHQEEIDLCWRLRNATYTIRFAPDSTVYHVGGATLDAMHPKKTFLNFRNSLFSLLKNKKGFGVWAILLVRLILDGLAAVRFLVQGKGKHFAAVLQAHLSFYKHLPYLLKRRRKISKLALNHPVKSIVFSYFVLKIRRFKNLV